MSTESRRILESHLSSTSGESRPRRLTRIFLLNGLGLSLLTLRIRVEWYLCPAIGHFATANRDGAEFRGRDNGRARASSTHRQGWRNEYARVGHRGRCAAPST